MLIGPQPTSEQRQHGVAEWGTLLLPVNTFFKLLLIQMLSTDLEPWGFLVLMLVKV